MVILALINVLDNDTLNGNPVTPSQVTITTGTLPPGITVDTATGVVGVAPGTPAGTYPVTYTICEVINPTNCSTNTINVVVTAPAIVANVDNPAPVNGADGNPTLINVLNNDTLNGNPVTPSQVIITTGTLPPGITVNTNTGVVSVAPGTPAGTYPVTYTICEVINPTNCSTNTINVVVTAPAIIANVDNPAPVNGADGNPALINVLDNDTLNGNPVTPSQVTITTGTLPPGITVDTATGVVGVAPGTPAGTYPVTYTICEVINPTNCSTSTINIVINPPAIVANVDNPAPVNGADGNPALINVLDNDTLNGNPVTPSQVTITTGTLPPGITVNTNTGVVSIAPGTPAGTYPVTYTICEVINPTNCSTNTINIVITAPIIDAVNDISASAVNTFNGGVAIANIFANDTLNGAQVIPSAVNLTTIGMPAGISINPATGAVVVEPDTPAGSYTFLYTICEVVNPTNCDTAFITVLVNGASTINAVDDAAPATIISNTGGTAITNIYGNDTLNLAPFTPATVNLTYTSPVAGITINPATGAVNVAPGTVPETYSFPYTICEVAHPGNCDTATITLTIISPIDAVDDDITGQPIVSSGSVTTAILNVFTNDTLNAAFVNPTDVTLTLVTADPANSITLNPDGTVDLAANTPAGTYNLTYSICEIANPGNCDTALVSVTVISPINAEDDANTTPIFNNVGGVAIANIYGNDTLNGTSLATTPALVNLTYGALPTGITIDAATGAVNVAPEQLPVRTVFLTLSVRLPIRLTVTVQS
ncbi:beta strand repeat-containing protein [Flavobacterium sp. 3HN19-14]|uniref:beta strand repeat-containing protein n=1 Tax=Flavobacterium sp. 3HN19-14 TaxID=3448133 RepID=UPI003EE0EFE8